MVLLPLGKGILPVVFSKGGKAGNTVNAYVYHYGIGITLGKVTKMVEHLCHHLAVRGLWLIVLARPRPLWVFRLVSLVILLHLGG
jgi:hypothetical protein